MDKPDVVQSNTDVDNFILNEVQLLLSEKRTALSTMRTGIAIFAFPLSVLSILIATSRSYRASEVMHWLVPLVLLNVGLIILGGISHHARSAPDSSLRPADCRPQAPSQQIE